VEEPEIAEESEIEPVVHEKKKLAKRPTLFSRLFRFLFKRKVKPEPKQEMVEESPESVPVGEEQIEDIIIPEYQVEPDSGIERLLSPIHLGKYRLRMKDAPDPIVLARSILVDSGVPKSDSESILQKVSSPWGLLHALSGKQLNSFCRLGLKPLESNQHAELLSALKSESESYEVKDTILFTLFSGVGEHGLSEAEVIEIWDDLNKVPQKHQLSAMFGHLFSRRGAVDWGWYDFTELSDEMKDIIEDQLSQMRSRDEEWVSLALKLTCAISIERPNELKQFSIRKRMGGNRFEDRVERWMKKHHPDVEYITEKMIKKMNGEIFGGIRLSRAVTPDILFKSPVKLYEKDEEIRWIDAKSHFIDPAFSPDKDIQSIANQMKKYVKNYGRGMIVWAAPYSSEWDTTEPNVFHHILN
jgi:hypothetical protein